MVESTLHHSTLARLRQPPIIRHRNNVHGAFSLEQPHLPADKPHGDDDDLWMSVFEDAPVYFYGVVCGRLEGGRVLANLEMHETDVSSNPVDDSASGLPQVGSIVTAR